MPGYSLNQEGVKIPDAQIEEYLMEYYFDDDADSVGYKKWWALLRSEKHLVINKKKVYRLCKGLGILQERKIKQPKHPRRLARKRVVTGPNQLWQIDIKYGNLSSSPYFVFVCAVIDVYDRSIVGYYRGPACKAEHITVMLTKALIRRKVHFKPGEYQEKLIIRSDNGPQFTSILFGDYCEHHKIYHERIPNKSPDMNAYIESFFSRLQAECFNRHTFGFYEEAYYYIDRFMTFYNERRPHGSLKYLSPKAYYELYFKGEINNVVSL